MANNYLLIDFENVQPESIALLDGLEFTILLFVGAHQTKIPLALATQLQQLGERARYVRIEGNGPNALDFHIVFTIGELARADPEGCFHIISKDTGFDPLIRYARGRRIAVQRSVAIAEIPLLKRLSAKSDWNDSPLSFRTSPHTEMRVRGRSPRWPIPSIIYSANLCRKWKSRASSRHCSRRGTSTSTAKRALPPIGWRRPPF